MTGRVCSRIERLENCWRPRQKVVYVFLTKPLEPGRRESLAPGERIVLDHHRWKGLMISASQRITTDPHDEGRVGEGAILLRSVPALTRTAIRLPSYGPPAWPMPLHINRQAPRQDLG